tara:strand:- start:432 stop:659 length:228 start_codon:yes stop_codon:yes gene_type:complete
MLDVFKSELRERVQSIEKRLNLMIGELEEIYNTLTDLRQNSNPNLTENCKEKCEEMEQRINSIEKKLLMGKYAPK